MIDISVLDTFKDAYLLWLLEKAEGTLDEQRLYLTKVPSLAKSIEEEIKKLNLSIELFFKAKANHDELTMRAALLRISTYLIEISETLRFIRTDVNLVFSLPSLSDFSEEDKDLDEQEIYRAIADLGQYIKKRDEYYLDPKHKNHIVVFHKKGRVRAALNFDGSFNREKTNAARAAGRVLTK